MVRFIPPGTVTVCNFHSCSNYPKMTIEIFCNRGGRVCVCARRGEGRRSAFFQLQKGSDRLRVKALQTLKLRLFPCCVPTTD